MKISGEENTFEATTDGLINVVLLKTLGEKLTFMYKMHIALYPVLICNGEVLFKCVI